MTRSGDPGGEMREEQWKYKRPGGDKSFSPSVFSHPVGRSGVLAARRGGLPNLLPSRSIFLLSRLRNCLDTRLYNILLGSSI